MHVLRAEKGYPIIGQDTDGTVTPQDLGMSLGGVEEEGRLRRQAVASPAPTTARADRKHLVGLLPVDPAALLPEGAQLVDGRAGSRRRRCRCSATSRRATAAPRSAAPSRSPCVRSGRDRIGERLYVALPAGQVAVEVTGPVLYDPEGTRRDG